MIFKRQIDEHLKDWKFKPNRKPLILRGARQVGKTTLVNQFAKTYKYYIQLNLERSSDIYYFTAFDDVPTIVNALFAANNISSEHIDDTLLFIDEIQESPKAIALLRYFHEDTPELHVIAAGSLLEHVMRHVKNIPVGRVNYMYLHPLNFAEYLQAKKQTGAIEQLQQIPLPPFAHQLLQQHFHEYVIIGGMPEVVANYIKSQSLSDLVPIYESIWTTYKDDVEKYAVSQTDARVIKHIVDTAYQYVDQRITFQNFGNSNYKSREIGEAMRKLNDARIIQLIYPSIDIKPPIKADFKKSPRLQFLDTGLVNYELNIQGDMLALQDLNTAYKGSIIPHMITQELMSLNTLQYKKPNFWVRQKAQSSAEVDLIVQHGDMVIPIEIKSGKEGRLKSLHQFVDKSDHPYAVRMYAGEFRIERHQTAIKKKPYLLMNLPYFTGTKIGEYISYFVDNHQL